MRFFFLFRFSRAAESHSTPHDATAELFLMMAESTLLITGAVGNIDTVNPELVLSRENPYGNFFSRSFSRTSHDRFCFPRVALEQHRRRKEKYLRGASMTVSPLSLVFYRVGRGGFQDQDIVSPRSPSFHRLASSFNSRCTIAV